MSLYESQGSAQEELDKYLDSIEGKVEQFKNKLQKLVYDIISSETVKQVVDSGSKLVGVLDKSAITAGGLVNIIGSLASGIMNLGSAILKILPGWLSFFGIATASSWLMFGKHIKNIAGSIGDLFNAISNRGQGQTIGSVLSSIFPTTITTKEGKAKDLLQELIGQGIGERNAQELIKKHLDTKYITDRTIVTEELTRTILQEADANGQLSDSIDTLSGRVVQSTQRTTLLGKALKLLKSPTFWVITAAVGAGIALYNLSKYSERLAKKAAEAGEALNEFSRNIKDDGKTIASLSARFTELSKKLDDNGNNIGLTSEEYAEYLNICNQVKDIIPEIVSGYDAENNAIITLTENVENLNQAYKKHTQSAAATFYKENQEDFKEIDKDFRNKNEGNIIDDFLFTPSLADKIIALKELLNSGVISNEDINNVLNSLNFNAYSYIDKVLRGVNRANSNLVHDTLSRELNALQSEMNDSVSKEKEIILTYIQTLDDYNVLTEDKDRTKAFNNFFNSIDNDFIVNNRLFDKNIRETFLSNFLDNISGDTTFATAFEKLFNFDYSNLSLNKASLLATQYAEEFKEAYIASGQFTEESWDTILNLSGLSKILSNDKYLKQVNNEIIKKIYGEDNFDALTLLNNQTQDFTQSQLETWRVWASGVADTFNDVNALWNAWITEQNNGIEKISWNDFLSSQSGLDIGDKFHISDNESKSTKKAEVWQDSINQYKEQISSLKSYIDKINSEGLTDQLKTELATTFSDVDITADANNIKLQLVGIMNELQNIMTEALEKEAGKAENSGIQQSLLLILETVKSINTEAQYLKDTFGLSGNALSDVNRLSDGFSKLESIYVDILDAKKGGDNVQFDYSAIIGNQDFKDTFGGYGKAYDDFIETVSNSPTDIDKCQKSFNNLATAYINGTGVLKEVTEETKNVAIAMLQQMGVSNAQEVVESRLNNLYNALNEANKIAVAQNQDLIIESENLSDASLEELSSLMLLANQAGVNTEVLFEYAYQKYLVNKQYISEDKSIKDLMSLAKAAGVAGKSVSKLAEIQKEITFWQDAFDTSGDPRGKSAANSNLNYWKKQAEKLQTEIESELANFNANIEYKANITAPEIEFDGGNSAKNLNEELENSANNLDWISILLSRIERQISNLDKIANGTWRNWGERNDALNSSLTKTIEKLGVQEAAAQAYLEAADSIALDEHYKELVRNGGLSLETITDEKLNEQINKYQELYEKYLEASDATLDLRDNLASIARQKFDNLKQQFEQITSEVNHFVTTIENAITKVETQNKIAGRTFYQAEIAYTQSNLDKMIEERGALAAKLSEAQASGLIEGGSQAWAEMRDEIYALDEEIQNAENSIEEFKNKIREVATLDFDDLKSQFETVLGLLDSNISLYESIIDYYEAGNKIAGTDFYKELISAQTTDISGLEQELNTLVATEQKYLNEGIIEEGSKEWYQMEESIVDTKQAIVSANTEIENLKKSLKQVSELDFSDLKKQFEDVISLVDGKVSIINSTLGYIESNNKIAGTNFYNILIDANKAALEQYKSEYATLQETMDKYLGDGTININDDEYYSMQQQLDELGSKVIDTSSEVLKLEDELHNVAKLDFDDLSKQFDNILSLLDSKIDIVDKTVSLIEATGHIASVEYFNNLAQAQKVKIDALSQDYETLVATRDKYLADGTLLEGSDNWYEMENSIDSVASSIVDATSTMVEFNNQIREARWGLDDRFIDSIQSFIDEAEWLATVIQADKKLFEENGAYTDEGFTVQGLHVEEYYANLEKAKDLAKQRQQLEQELLDDPTNIQLIDRQKELIEAEQSAIKAAQDEKTAIKDLIEEGYNTLLSYIDKLISRYEEALDTQKDLYDYEKTVREKTDNITSLQKQVLAYSGDNSEEAMAKMQQLEEDLEAAQEDLQETEYERYISDQKKMLDNFKDNLQEWVNIRLDNIDGLLRDAITETTLTGDKIKAVLDNTEEGWGYSITSTNREIWNEFSEGIGNSIDTNLGSLENCVQGATANIDNFVHNELPTTLTDNNDDILTKLGLSGTTIENVLNGCLFGLDAQAKDTYVRLGEIQSKVVGENDSIFSWIKNFLGANTISEVMYSTITSMNNAATTIASNVVGVGTVLESSSQGLANIIGNMSYTLASSIATTNTYLAQIQSNVVEMQGGLVNSIGSIAGELAYEKNMLASASSSSGTNRGNSGYPQKPSNAGQVYYIVDEKGGYVDSANDIQTAQNMAAAYSSAYGKNFYTSTDYSGKAVLEEQKESRPSYYIVADGAIIHDALDNPLYFNSEEAAELKRRRLIQSGEYDSSQLKIQAFAKGGHDLAQQLAIWNEAGQEMLFSPSTGAVLTRLNKGDSVFNADMTDTLWNFAKNPQAFMNGMSSINIPLPAMKSTNPNITTGDTNITLNLPNVTNKEEFVNWLKTDKNVTKIMQEATIGQMLGHNTYTKLKY